MSWFRDNVLRPAKYFWLLYIVVISGIALLFVTIATGVWGRLPSIAELQSPQSSTATEVISADGVVLGKYFRENRTNVSFEHLPPCLIDALLATEDVRFYDHTGVDLKAIGRVVKGVLSHDSKGGGSTITQQLAKNLFPRKKRGSRLQLVLQKFKEWVIAARLEHTFTKEEILALYFNTVPFSDNAYGISTASRTYFSKPVDSLNAQEAAVLVGMLKGPSEYSPRAHPEASKRRRDVVIGQMANYHFITREQRDSLTQIPITLAFDAGTHEDGPAPYFREYLRLYVSQLLDSITKPDGTKYDLYKDGLKIYTTIDSRMQRYAEEAQREHLEEWQKLFFKMSAKDPWKEFPEEWERTYTQSSRYRQYKALGKSREEIDTLMSTPIHMRIFSWQGERDTVMSPRDSIRYHRMILQNGFLAPRSPSPARYEPGSAAITISTFSTTMSISIPSARSALTFKPFIYTAAIREKGYSPCYEVPNEPVTFEKGDPRFHLLEDWTPHNSDGKYGGTLNLKQGLANSVNCITAYLMHELSPETVVRLVHDMGVKSNIPDEPSICLGTADISLIEMAGAYTTFANKGVHVEPIFMTRIEDRSGNVIASFSAVRNEVLDEQTAYVMVDLLRGVVLYGTGVRLRYKYHLMGDIIGKTGTTQNNSDGWFMGCTPDLVTATWVGCEDRFIRFRSMEYGQGASTALPICAKFFQKVYSDSTNLGISPSRVFDRPAKIGIELNCKNFTGQQIDRSQDFGDEEVTH